jgi:hypothetical protein
LDFTSQVHGMERGEPVPMGHLSPVLTTEAPLAGVRIRVNEGGPWRRRRVCSQVGLQRSAVTDNAQAERQCCPRRHARGGLGRVRLDSVALLRCDSVGAAALHHLRSSVPAIAGVDAAPAECCSRRDCAADRDACRLSLDRGRGRPRSGGIRRVRAPPIGRTGCGNTRLEDPIVLAAMGAGPAHPVGVDASPTWRRDFLRR